MTTLVQRAFKRLRRFSRKEEGMTIHLEFMICFPLMFTGFMMSVELGVYAMQNMFLDRGLDITVRHIRLNTNTTMSHNDIKTMICDNAGFLEDCENTLRLEMKPLDPRAFEAFDQVVDCVDLSEPVTPVRGFILGREHQLMVLRACYKFEPVFPTSGLGYAAVKDGSGMVRMTSAAVFVQEPN